LITEPPLLFLQWKYTCSFIILRKKKRKATRGFIIFALSMIGVLVVNTLNSFVYNISQMYFRISGGSNSLEAALLYFSEFF